MGREDGVEEGVKPIELHPFDHSPLHAACISSNRYSPTRP